MLLGYNAREQREEERWSEEDEQGVHDPVPTDDAEIRHALDRIEHRDIQVSVLRDEVLRLAGTNLHIWKTIYDIVITIESARAKANARY